METVLVERQKMGRPKRVVATTSIKIEEDAYELVRKAATFLDQSVVEYVSRILREQARKDLREGAEKFLREDNPEQEPKKPSRKKGGEK
jgi:uncharacterized protein (DUF1778 family)